MDRNQKSKWLLAVSVVVMLSIYGYRFFPHREKPPAAPPPTERQLARFKQFKEQSEHGDVDSQLRLAWMYEHGRGVKADASEAARLYGIAVTRLRASADRGVPEAQMKLGEMYQEGYGVGRDLSEAGDLYRKAANGGNADAQNNLALMYNAGVGVPMDYVEAYKWYTLAAANGNPEAAGSRSMMARHMKPEQISLGQKRADEFTAKEASRKNQ